MLFRSDEFGTPEMIAGMVVLVSFPMIGYALMHYLEGRERPPQATDVAGGDD